jgi:hypothetical protein
MDDELYSFALKSALTEIHNTCPEIKHSFAFNQGGQIIAGDENTPENTVHKIMGSLNTILEKADAIGGIDNITLESSKGRVNISCLSNLYLVTVTSRNADKNYVNTVTHVLIPTVLKLLEKITPTPLKNNKPEPEVKPPIPITPKDTEELSTSQPDQSPQKETEPEPTLQELPASQFIVENIGGLLVPNDTIRIDSETLSKWEELFPEKEIKGVKIETYNGKTTRCKVKPMKKSKQEGMGIVQIPEKILDTLEIKKGELVKIKPIIE